VSHDAERLGGIPTQSVGTRSVGTRNGLDFFDPKEDIDLIRVEKMPLLCIEIASPSQSSVYLLSKFKAYFAMGVKSCWYVDSALRQINIYSHSKELGLQSETYVSKGEVYDKALEIQIPLEKIFFSR
jgi:Uma2 family endonuclease